MILHTFLMVWHLRYLLPSRPRGAKGYGGLELFKWIAIRIPQRLWSFRTGALLSKSMDSRTGAEPDARGARRRNSLFPGLPGWRLHREKPAAVCRCARVDKFAEPLQRLRLPKSLRNHRNQSRPSAPGTPSAPAWNRPQEHFSAANLRRSQSIDVQYEAISRVIVANARRSRSDGRVDRPHPRRPRDYRIARQTGRADKEAT